MRISCLLMVLYLGLTLSSCTSINTAPPATHAAVNPSKKIVATKKNPLTVSFYPAGINPKIPYTVVGQTVVSKYNVVGIKRKEAIIHDVMRTLATSMGGAAVINISRDKKTVSGSFIVYHKQTLV